MLLNYFLLALRNVKKQRGYAFVNTLGLAIGLASALFIFLYVRHEQTYDSFHPYADQTYRLGYRMDYKNGQSFARSYNPCGIPTCRFGQHMDGTNHKFVRGEHTGK